MEGRVHPTATGWRGAEQDWLGYDQQQWLRFQQDGKYILELCTHTYIQSYNIMRGVRRSRAEMRER